MEKQFVPYYKRVDWKEARRKMWRRLPYALLAGLFGGAVIYMGAQCVLFLAEMPPLVRP